jgi:hypothetical protein
VNQTIQPVESSLEATFERIRNLASAKPQWNAKRERRKARQREPRRRVEYRSHLPPGDL